MVAFFVAVPDYDVSMYEHKKSKCDPAISLSILKGVRPILQVMTSWDNDHLFQVLKDYGEQSGYKTGTVMWPIRTALSGIPATPGGATALAEILGKAETIRRIDAGIEKLEEALGNP